MVAKPLAVLTVEDCQQILQLSLQPQRINSLADLAKVKYAPFQRTLPVLAESKRKMSSICRKVCHCKNLKCNMSNVTGNSSQKSCPKKGRFEVGEPIQASERMQSLHLNFAPLLPAGDFSVSDSLVLNFYYKLVFYVSKAVRHTFSLSIRN